MPANFNPDFVGYTNQGAFRFWCQKVLPLVYDDSLSYYELLNKVVDYLNNVISDVANVETNLDALHTAYGQLQGYVNEQIAGQRGYITLWTEQMQEAFDTLQQYVNNYFDNLDVQDEINAKLDQMAYSGQLSDLLRPLIGEEAPGIITQWLEDNVDPSTSPIVDASLSIEGAAADAKATGTKMPMGKSVSSYVVDGNIDLSSIVEQGNYSLGTSNTIQNGPTEFTPTGLIVRAFSTISGSGNFVRQVAVRITGYADDRYAIRHSTGTGSWTNWQTYYSVGPIEALIGDSVTALSNKCMIPRNPAEYVTEGNLDLDDMVNQGHFIIDTNVTLEHSPTMFRLTGLIVERLGTVYNNDHFVRQTAVLMTGDKERIAIRHSNGSGTWYDWREIGDVTYKDVMTPKSASKFVVEGVLDLNDIIEQGHYVLSSTSYTLLNTPTGFKPTGIIVEKFQTADNDHFIRQTALRITTGADKQMVRHSDASGSWSAWSDIGGSGGNVNNNYYEINQNAYAIGSVNPNVNTSTPYLLTSTGDSTDRTTEIATMLSTFGCCQLGTGDFYVGNLTVPANCSLFGSGIGKTVVKMISGTTGDAITLSSKSSVSNLSINGGDGTHTDTNGGRHGIGWVGTYIDSSNPGTVPRRGQLSNVYIENMSGSGIHCSNTSMSISTGINVVNVNIHNCWAGIYIPIYSEFNRFTSVEIDDCEYGVINNSGNNMFANCAFNGCAVGFLIDNSTGQSPNNSHGSVVGCTFCHFGDNNDGVAVWLRNPVHGYIFNACQFYYGSLTLESAIGIQFTGCNIGNGVPIIIDGGGVIMFSNNTFEGNSTVSKTNNPIISATNNKLFSGGDKVI